MAILDIFLHGRTYQIACDDGQEPHVRELGKALDARVTDLAKRMGGNVPEASLLAITSLMLLDELEEQKKQASGAAPRTADDADAIESSVAEAMNQIAAELEKYAAIVENR